MTSSRGGNGDHVISGQRSKLNSTETVRPIYANNNANHALSYKELHFGGLDGLEPLWGK